MNRVRAVVVGVSRYLLEGWSMEGPARNAGIIAAGLLHRGLSVDRLHVFAEGADMAEADREYLAEKGVEFQPTSFAAINTFWRTELRDAAVQGDALLLFWSGHGVTSQQQQRVFFCSDYQREIPANVFNATGFTNHLKAGKFTRFTDQLILADACGTYAKVPIDPASDAPAVLQGARQQAIWASPDGSYAREDEGAGVFTRVVDGVLADLGLDPWPAQDKLIEAIRARTAEWPYPPTHVRWNGNDGSDGTDLGVKDQRAALTQSLLATLSAHPIPDEVTERAYAHTVRHLNLRAGRCSGLPDAVAELTDLEDEWNQGAPFALVMFLQRMVNDPDLPAEAVQSLKQWINQNSTTYIRGKARQAIAKERQTLLLLVEIESEPVSGAPRCLVATLHYPDLALVPGFETRRKPGSDQASFDAAIVELVGEVADSFMPAEIEIHILVDPPAFGWPFHLATMADGTALGEAHICVAHYRRRARTRAGQLVDQWRAWADILADPIAATALHILPPPPEAVPTDKGIFYVEQPLAAASDPANWRQLERLLRLGAPYLCWSLADDAHVPTFPAALNGLIGPTARFDRMPGRLFNERMRGCLNARLIALLWDGPTFRPYDYADLRKVE